MAYRRDLGGMISADVLSIIAAYRLREVAVGSIRGLAQLLKSGGPHGILPHWLRRSDNGHAEVIQERADVIRRMIEFAMGHEVDLGYAALAQIIQTYSQHHRTSLRR